MPGRLGTAKASLKHAYGFANREDSIHTPPSPAEGLCLGFGKAKGDWANFNTPADGAAFEGFRWRTVPELNVNHVWAYLYMTDVPTGHVSKVWFDHIVVATDYIGPIRK